MIRYLFRLFSAFLTCLVLVSCDKSQWLDREDYQAPPTEAPELLLSLEATLGKATRSLSFDPANLLTPTVPEEGLDVLCIVRSSDPADQPIYRTITWAKDPNVPNRIYLRNYRLRLLPGMQLAGKRWYIMGVIGGEWDEASQQLRVSTNTIGTFEPDSPVSLNVPAVSSWVELPISEIQDPQVYRYTVLHFQTQGALVQHKLQSNTSGHDMHISSFTVVSTAFSFEGHYDLSAANLPNVDNSTAGHKNSGLLRWTPSGASATKEYGTLNRDIVEYKHKFRLPKTLTFSARTNNGDKVMTFWVMPTGQPVGKSRSNVFVEARASSGSYFPKVLRLPVYGKNHKSVLKTGDFAILKANLHRPKLAIEYMAEYNVKRKKMPNGNAWGALGTTKPDGSTDEFASDHGQEAVSGLTYDEAVAVNIPGYHLPDLNEWAGIFPVGATSGRCFKPNGVNTPTTYPRENMRATVAGQTDVYGFQLRQTRSVNYPNGFGTSYAIHFMNDAQGNKMRVAYRYSLVPNPPFQNEIGTSKPALGVAMLTTKEVYTPQAHEVVDLGSANPFLIKNYHATTLRVDMIYLGAHFLGTIEDIAHEAWWEDQERNVDMVTRHISSNAPSFIGFVYHIKPLSNDVDKRVYQFLQPSTCAYWIKSEAQERERDKREYGYIACRSTYLFSMNTGGSSIKEHPKPTGSFVRLFSDR